MKHGVSPTLSSFPIQSPPLFFFRSRGPSRERTRSLVSILTIFAAAAVLFSPSVEKHAAAGITGNDHETPRRQRRQTNSASRRQFLSHFRGGVEASRELNADMKGSTTLAVGQEKEENNGLMEPILAPSTSRFILLPIKYDKVWKMYKQHQV